MTEQQLFNLEWGELEASHKNWTPKGLEFPAVSAFNILNYTTNDSEVCAFDSYGAATRISDWFTAGSSRWLVWDACKGAIAKGRREADKVGLDSRIGIRRIFIIEREATRAVAPSSTVSLGPALETEPGATTGVGVAAPSSLSVEGRNALLAVIWAQLMIGVKVAVYDQAEYVDKEKKTYDALAGFPDYMTIRLPSGSNSEAQVKCVGWVPQGIWYPYSAHQWPIARVPSNPSLHFESVWQSANGGQSNGGRAEGEKTVKVQGPYNPEILLQRLRLIFGQPTGCCGIDADACRKVLRALDSTAFSNFEPTWRSQVQALAS